MENKNKVKVVLLILCIIGLITLTGMFSYSVMSGSNGKFNTTTSTTSGNTYNMKPTSKSSTTTKDITSTTVPETSIYKKRNNTTKVTENNVEDTTTTEPTTTENKTKSRDDYSPQNNNNYLINDCFALLDGEFWTLSLSQYSRMQPYEKYVYIVDSSGAVRQNLVQENFGVRPAILLKSNIIIEPDGNGTRLNPYVIN